MTLIPPQLTIPIAMYIVYVLQTLHVVNKINIVLIVVLTLFPQLNALVVKINITGGILCNSPMFLDKSVIVPASLECVGW